MPDTLMAREVDNIPVSGKTPSMMAFAQNPYFNPTTPRRRQVNKSNMSSDYEGEEENDVLILIGRRHLHTCILICPHDS